MEKLKIFLFLLPAVFLPFLSPGQYTSWECGFTETSPEDESLLHSLTCSSNSVWTDVLAYRPFSQQVGPLTLQVNFIFWLHETPLPDGTRGNFEKTNADHMLFINLIIEEMNRRISHLVDPDNPDCYSDADQGNNYLMDAGIRFDVRTYFIPSSYHWNIQNATNDLTYCPENWDYSYYSTAVTLLQQYGVREGINVFFGNEANAYYNLLIYHTTSDFAATASLVDCSEAPSLSNLALNSRITMNNEFLEYRFANEIAGNFNLDHKYQVARILLHELGHTLNLGHFFGPGPCPENIMQVGNSSQLNYLTPFQTGVIHRSLHLYSVRKYVRCALPGSVPRVLTGDHTWAFNTKLYSDLILEPGTTLTLCGKLYMPENGKIIVKRGAKLLIKGGLISINREEYGDCTNGYWDGIYVLGNPCKAHSQVNTNALQDDDPGIVIINEGTIERARNAINLQHWDKYQVSTYSGGILQAHKATLLNNVCSVRFSSYAFLNLSSFNECVFISTEGIARQGAVLCGVNGVIFQKCIFDHLNDVGLLLYASQASITNGCVFKRIFGGHGIYVVNEDPFSGLVQIGAFGADAANRNKFEGNYCGIYAGAASAVSITDNDFLFNNFGVSVSGEASVTSLENRYTEHVVAENYVQSGQAAFNETLCNIFQDVGYGLRFTGNNTGMTFNGNDFTYTGGLPGNPRADVFLGGVNVDAQFIPGRLKNQGSINDAHSNYFGSFMGEDFSSDIIASPHATHPFYYFHPDDASQTPSCSLNSDCAYAMISNFYTFPANERKLPCTNIVPSLNKEACKDRDCLSTFYRDIENLEQSLGKFGKASFSPAIVPAPGARTVLEDALHEAVLHKQEALFNLVASNIMSGNFTEAEALLVEDGSLPALRELVYARLRAGNLSGAATALNQLPDSTPEAEQFYILADAAIQLAASDTAMLDATTLKELLAIANSQSCLSGRAQAMLFRTRGMIFLPALPEEKNNLRAHADEEIGDAAPLSGIATHSRLSGHSVSVFPVPAHHELRVMASGYELPLHMVMLDINGRAIRELTILPAETLSFSLDGVPAGLYLLRWQESGQVKILKFLVQQ